MFFLVLCILWHWNSRQLGVSSIVKSKCKPSIGETKFLHRIFETGVDIIISMPNPRSIEEKKLIGFQLLNRMKEE
jgi:hypothetical protein